MKKIILISIFIISLLTFFGCSKKSANVTLKSENIISKEVTDITLEPEDKPVEKPEVTPYQKKITEKKGIDELIDIINNNKLHSENVVIKKDDTTITLNEKDYVIDNNIVEMTILSTYDFNNFYALLAGVGILYDEKENCEVGKLNQQTF